MWFEGAFRLRLRNTCRTFCSHAKWCKRKVNIIYGYILYMSVIIPFGRSREQNTMCSNYEAITKQSIWYRSYSIVPVTCIICIHYRMYHSPGTLGVLDKQPMASLTWNCFVVRAAAHMEQKFKYECCSVLLLYMLGLLLFLLLRPHMLGQNQQ